MLTSYIFNFYCPCREFNFEHANILYHLPLFLRFLLLFFHLTQSHIPTLSLSHTHSQAEQFLLLSDQTINMELIMENDFFTDSSMQSSKTTNSDNKIVIKRYRRMERDIIGLRCEASFASLMAHGICQHREPLMCSHASLQLRSSLCNTLIKCMCWYYISSNDHSKLGRMKRTTDPKFSQTMQLIQEMIFTRTNDCNTAV